MGPLKWKHNAEYTDVQYGAQASKNGTIYCRLRGNMYLYASLTEWDVKLEV